MKIVIPSCSKYIDSWLPFSKLMDHFWPDRPYDTVLITDDYELKPFHNNVLECKFKYIYWLKEDYGWSTNLMTALVDFIYDEFILLIQDDFFLSAKVDTSLVNRAVDLISEHKDINCIRLFPCPGPNSEYNEDFGIIAENAQYRVSCQAAIWRIDHLIHILEQTDSPTSFELDGSKLKPNGLYLSVYRKQPYPFDYICSAISRGKWNPDAIKLCNNLNIPIDTSRRLIDN